MYDSLIVAYLIKVAFHLGFLLAFEKLFFLLLRFVVHIVFRVPNRSVSINVFFFILRTLVCAYIFMLAAGVVLSVPNDSFVIAAWVLYGIFILFYCIGSVMPMREAWSYTQNGPLMGRAYVDVFHPWLTLIVFALMSWLVDAKNAVNETIIRVPSNVIGVVFDQLSQLKSFSDNVDLEKYSLTVLAIFGLFLAYHFLRGLYCSWDYFVNLSEVLRGETPSDEIVEAVAKKSNADETELKNGEDVSSEEKPNE